MKLSFQNVIYPYFDIQSLTMNSFYSQLGPTIKSTEPIAVMYFIINDDRYHIHPIYGDLRRV